MVGAVAPCDGKVLVAVDALPDMTPPQYEAPARLAGNHVMLACADVQVALAHFRQGSVRVGDAVRAVVRPSRRPGDDK